MGVPSKRQSVVPQPRPFYVSHIDDAIRRRLEGARRRIPKGFYYFRTHPKAHNLEIMMAPDLAVNLAGLPNNVSPEERARLVLINLSADFGLDPEVLERQLTVKHTMKSLVGSHCIFDLRDSNGREILPGYFAVHLDSSQRVVMIHCAYQNSIDPSAETAASTASLPAAGALAYSPEVSSGHVSRGREVAGVGSRDWEHLVRRQLSTFVREEAEAQKSDVTIRSVSFSYDIWLPDWEKERYVRGCQAKVQTDQGDYVFLISLRDDTWHVMAYDAVSKLNPNGLALGLVYAEFWQNRQDPGVQPGTSPVVLRGLRDTRGGLRGTYVSVLDNLTDYLLDDIDNANWLIDPKTIRSDFDRVMAYYHIDLAQRYFRQLGLTVLDDDPYLKPLQIVLTGRAGSHVGAGYRHDRRSIVLRQLFDGMVTVSSEIQDNPDFEWTLARDARVLYHEYVHAVTDSLARLQRVDKTGVDCKNVRLLEMIQAVAMDEGLADYFACSIVQAQGAPAGELGELTLRDGYLLWTRREERCLDVNKADLRKVIQTDWKELHALCESRQSAAGVFIDRSPTLEKVYYQWGTIWASFLWRLRDEIGRDAADTLIAHSILFLSRWSGFLVGVCALIQADLLLYGGVYRNKIVELSGLEDELKLPSVEDIETPDGQPPHKQAMSMLG